MARAQLLAAPALRDSERRAQAEAALLDVLTDPAQLRAMVDSGLCHGVAGLARLAARAVLPSLLATLVPPGAAPEEAATTLVNDRAGPGLLDGAAGTALGVLTAASAEPPRTAWDACLLIA
ncbi:hypothetical protein [Streptomyces pseudovenezuelae]|uniref:Uncharacterized protein n=1 Tax=Streptomyces pseudovenezuelae TaxID=67350 RepID=A0ABT6LYY1_9ACTN|nr:hypothetical protein [Streptomyces pseudovenezuelae]